MCILFIVEGGTRQLTVRREIQYIHPISFLWWDMQRAFGGELSAAHSPKYHPEVSSSFPTVVGKRRSIAFC